MHLQLINDEVKGQQCIKRFIATSFQEPKLNGRKKLYPL